MNVISQALAVQPPPVQPPCKRLPEPSMRRWARGVGLAFACALSGLGSAHAELVRVPSLDTKDGQAVVLPAYWLPSSVATDRAPAILLLHGCGGPYGRKGDLSVRMRDYAALLNAEGWHVLVTDSLTPRGETELCTQRNGARRVTQTERRRDALGALAWLSQQPGIDASRLALLGWSNGGSTVLATLNSTHEEIRVAQVRPRAAVAFYPGCESERQRGFATVTPLLMLLGGVDDWTPPAACQALADSVGPPAVQAITYPGAYHGFDGTAPVRLRLDVPNGGRPGHGVHVGGDPAARIASQAALLGYLRGALTPCLTPSCAETPPGPPR